MRRCIGNMRVTRSGKGWKLDLGFGPSTLLALAFRALPGGKLWEFFGRRQSHDEAVER